MIKPNTMTQNRTGIEVLFLIAPLPINLRFLILNEIVFRQIFILHEGVTFLIKKKRSQQDPH
jgi:hypothetical protein